MIIDKFAKLYPSLKICLLTVNAENLMYWASIDKPAVEMSSLDGTGRVTLLNESNANYTGLTLYNNCLYISDLSRRSVFYSVLTTVTRCPLADYHA